MVKGSKARPLLFILSKPARPTLVTMLLVRMWSLSGVRVASGSRYWARSSPPVGYWFGGGEFQPAAVSRRSEALSMAYSQGENNGTWLHWRTAWPTCGPASSTIGCMPRSSTCAAAARPTGPAPRMATVFGLFSESGMAYSSSPRIIEILRQKKSGGDLFELRHDGGRARAFDAAFRDHVVDQAMHLVVAGIADQRRALAGLGDEADADQRLEVMRERRGSDVQSLLQAADRHALFARPHQRAVDF